MTKAKTMIGYKGFDENWKCKNQQYKVGETVEFDGDIKLCVTGLHFCERPLDVLRYYRPVGSNFAIVEAESVSDKTESDSKRVAKKLTITASITLKDMINASVKFIFDKIETNKKIKPVIGTKTTTGYYAHAATTGNSAHAATTGYYAHAATTGNSAHAATTGNSAHAATTGNSAHAATTGDSADAATTGYYAHAATTGYSADAATTGYSAHAATTGYYAHAATTGDSAHAATTGYSAHAATTGNSADAATTGDYADAATTGDYADAATTGYSAHAATTGNECAAVAVGRNCKAKGSVGSWLVLAEWIKKNNKLHRDSIQTVKVDGKKIKADVFYKLEGGKFVEVE